MLIRALMLALVASHVLSGCSQWVTRDERWPIRGVWLWSVSQELPDFYRELNAIDFGHAFLGQTLLETQDAAKVEEARQEVLAFIARAPEVPPDEEIIAPTMSRLVWEAQRAFNWAHTLHRTIYDILAGDHVPDKDAAIRRVVAEYLSKPEAITDHRLDLHGKLYAFPESGAFHRKFPRFNAQIWSYHWLQAGAYDLQLIGGPARQRELMPKLIAQYHAYLSKPPLDWPFMPMMQEAAPDFARRYPQLAVIFDNLHMLHDNIDDVLSRPELYPTLEAKREAVLRILPIYLHRNHVPDDRFAAYHGMHQDHLMNGPRAPTMREILFGDKPASQTPFHSH